MSSYFNGLFSVFGIRKQNAALTETDKKKCLYKGIKRNQSAIIEPHLFCTNI